MRAAKSPGRMILRSSCHVCVPALTEMVFATWLYLAEYDTETNAKECPANI